MPNRNVACLFTQENYPYLEEIFNENKIAQPEKYLNTDLSNNGVPYFLKLTDPHVKIGSQFTLSEIK